MNEVEATKEECRRQITSASIMTEVMDSHGDKMGKMAAERLMQFLQKCEKYLYSEAALKEKK